MAIKTITRAEKKDAVKNIIRELLSTKGYKHNELLDEVSAQYLSKYEESDNINDVKGRVGSILDVMKKEGDVMEDGGLYMLKARLPLPEPTAEKPTKKPRAKKVEKVTEKAVEQIPATPETEKSTTVEKPVKKPRSKKTAEEKPTESKIEETEKTVKKSRSKKVAEETPTENKPEGTPVKKTRAKKTVAKKEEKKDDKKEEKKDKPTVIPENEPVIVPTPIPAPVSEPTPTPAPIADPAPTLTVSEEKKEAQKEEKKAVTPVFDMTALFTASKTPKKPELPVAQAEPVKQVEEKPATTENDGGRVALKEKTPEVKSEQKPEPKPTEKPVEQPKKAEVKTAQKPVEQPKKVEQPKPQQEKPTTPTVRGNVRRLSQAKPAKPLTADEVLREAFLKKLRSLGGDYFEYYSVYLLERYSLRNGRRLESLRISGGDHDGGIDGEIELTDKFGFKETIYIQAKNWNPDKGNESLWVVGETLLQQFLGACAYRQAKDGKQHSRGIFITTSRFTPDAKRMLDELSDKLVGYDGNDLFEAAKECSFGLIQKNGNWVLDEKLLSGEKAFFNLF